MKYLIFCCVALAFSSQCIGADIDMFKYSLQPLSPSEKAFSDLSGKARLMLFFEPDCPWCLKQIRLLNKLQENCAEPEVVGIGLNSSFRILKRTVQQYRPTFPTFFADEHLLSDLGDVAGLPFIIYVNQAGHFVKYARGFQNKARIISEISGFLPESCLLTL